MALINPISELDDTDLWQEAQDRVLLYLKRLGMPAMQSLKITEKALHQAVNASQDSGTDHPIQLAMRSLHEIILRDIDLLGNSKYKEYPIVYRRWHWPHKSGADSRTPSEFRSKLEPSASPPINRGFMKFKKI